MLYTARRWRRLTHPRAVGAPTLTERRRRRARGHDGRQVSARTSSWRVVGLAALALSAIGVLLTLGHDRPGARRIVRARRVWPESISPGPGALRRARRRRGTQLVASGCEEPVDGNRAASSPGSERSRSSVYEIADIIAVPTQGLALDVGVGLYLCGFATLAGSRLQPDRRRRGVVRRRPSRPAGGLRCSWVGGLLALGVVAASSFLGYQAAASPVGPVPVLSPERPVTNGGGGPGPVGGGSTGGTGSPGNSGNSGNSGTRETLAPREQRKHRAWRRSGNFRTGEFRAGKPRKFRFRGVRNRPIRQLGHRRFRSRRHRDLEATGGSARSGLG